MSIELTNVVEVFPSTKTNTINRLITENSLTRLINRLLDVDGYIITSEFGDDVNVNGQYEYVTVSGDNGLLSKNLEFSLRGYYFNLGTYESVIEKIDEEYKNPVEDSEIDAVIYIDNTTPEYPELYGYNYEPITDTSGENSFAEMYDNNNSYNFKFYNVSGVQVNVETSGFGTNAYAHVLMDKQTPPQPINFAQNNIAKVTFIHMTTEACVQLYLHGENTPPAPNAANNASSNFKSYTLPLFVRKNGNWAIPVSSFHKFASLSVQDVDGGVIDLDKQ